MYTVDEMQAGRELDALVAEKVMGLSLMRHTHYPEREPVIIGGALGDWPKVPNYSTDISAAWQVVEKMEADRRSVDLFSNVIMIPGKRWHVHITPQGGNLDFQIDAYADAAPLAICRAALKAIGYKP